MLYTLRICLSEKITYWEWGRWKGDSVAWPDISILGGTFRFLVWRWQGWAICQIVTFSCLSSFLLAVAPPFITQHPEGDITLENNVEVLRCSAIGDAPLLYRWWKDDVPVMDSYISSSNYRLAAINRNDAGMYRCLVNNPVGTIISKVANIQVACKYIFSTPCLW